jgi:hypothetical protein
MAFTKREIRTVENCERPVRCSRVPIYLRSRGKNSSTSLNVCSRSARRGARSRRRANTSAKKISRSAGSLVVGKTIYRDLASAVEINKIMYGVSDIVGPIHNGSFGAFGERIQRVTLVNPIKEASFCFVYTPFILLRGVITASPWILQIAFNVARVRFRPRMTGVLSLSLDTASLTASFETIRRD